MPVQNTRPEIEQPEDRVETIMAEPLVDIEEKKEEPVILTEKKEEVNVSQDQEVI